jgi:hypothetical protein
MHYIYHQLHLHSFEGTDKKEYVMGRRNLIGGDKPKNVHVNLRSAVLMICLLHRGCCLNPRPSARIP